MSEKNPAVDFLRKKEKKGFTLIEIIVVVAIIGLLVVVFYPAVLNTLENRDIENAARLIQMTFQQAKFEAIRAKVNHRVRFWQDNAGQWFYNIERELSLDTWQPLHGSVPRRIPAKFIVILNIPEAKIGQGKELIFDPIGMVYNYDPSLRSISIRSPKLSQQGQQGTIIINIYAGGSFQYVRTA
ncbi:MAG: prepilin-type N-terminal cleavage/methylation domain-containing protein [Candidatus Aminicenantes bacterium]|nr:prepilin-type N-terminal cleavage/methylation domain-containing protein [Candidatus Aminicenantes bacterium]